MNANELRERMQALPEPPSDSKPPFWDYWRHDLWARVVGGLGPEGFAGWPSIYHTMRVDHWYGATEIEHGRLEVSGDPRYLEACIMPDFGYPKDYYKNKYSAALIHQAHHLYQWMKRAKLTVNDLNHMHSIFEFGGGYGAMALVLRRLGFIGHYTIFDLPEFALLQEYYLSSVGVDRLDLKWITEPKGLRKERNHDLFIACFSLSEVDLKLRFDALKHQTADDYLFLYSGRFVNYDNWKYFEEVVPEYFDDHTWEIVKADHLPDDNRYAFGIPK